MVSRTTNIESRFSLVRAANVWSGDEGWELLFYYNIYRFGLAVLLIALASPEFNVTTIGYQTSIPAFAIVGFVLASVAALFTIKKQSPAIHLQAHALFMLDILFISALALSQELHDSSIIIFFFTTVGATAVMFRTKTSLAYAAIAIIIIYIRDTLNILQGSGEIYDYYLSALTALGLFTIVIVVSRIAKQTRVVQNVLEQQELELQDLDDINQIVIDQLEIGILFVDDDLTVKMINKTARMQIGEYIVKGRAAGKLEQMLKMFLSAPSNRQFSIRHVDRVLSLSTTTMRSGFLVKIEDRTRMSRRIQQTKLSSVGRFASAVSHEIRNPLNAINHAAQLMEPGGSNDEAEELVGIIRKHVQRIDNIIESIVERSLPGRAQQKKLKMDAWLDRFIETFRQTIGTREISMVVSGNPISVYFDPIQLEQILTNLCQNSLKYGDTGADMLEIAFHSDIDEEGVPFMNVTDNGDPISDSIVDQLFEPFYSSDSRSSGLGLYLSREFCSLNGADIDYFSGVENHGFKLSFRLQEAI